MNLKENKFTIFFTVLVIAITIFNVYERNEIEKMLEELDEAIELEEGECWLWVEGSNGNGFGDTINHCYQTKRNCKNSNHNIPCEWIERTISINEFGNETRTAEGCKCMLW